MTPEVSPWWVTNRMPRLVCPSVRMASLARNMRQGLDKILKMMRMRVGTAPTHVAVMHAYAPEEGEKLKARIAAEFNCCDLWLGEFSPVMGYATGTGTLGVAFYKDGGAAGPVPDQST